jgi:exodeoxyribonuclease VII small subunit
MSDEPSTEAISYGDAITEIETILAGIESSDIDIDQLGAKVARAAELIELCRGRIQKAEAEVERIVEGMDAQAND